MDKARSSYENAHHHRWNWKCWNRLPVVGAEDGVVEFIEEHFRLFDDNTQGDNLAVELTISSNMGKEHFRIESCQGRDAWFVFFRLDDLMTPKSDLFSAWYTRRVN